MKRLVVVNTLGTWLAAWLRACRRVIANELRSNNGAGASVVRSISLEFVAAKISRNSAEVAVGRRLRCKIAILSSCRRVIAANTSD